MSNAIGSQLLERTHCEGGRILVDVQLATYEDQLRHGQIHKLAGIEKRT
jgi:hypothetical protein